MMCVVSWRQRLRLEGHLWSSAFGLQSLEAWWIFNPPASFFLCRNLLALGQLFLGQFFLSFQFSSDKVNLGHLCVFSRMYPEFWRVHVRSILLFLWARACCVVRDELPNTVKQMQTTDQGYHCLRSGTGQSGAGTWDISLQAHFSTGEPPLRRSEFMLSPVSHLSLFWCEFRILWNC